jgi:hypothetical protein
MGQLSEESVQLVYAEVEVASPDSHMSSIVYHLGKNI